MKMAMIVHYIVLEDKVDNALKNLGIKKMSIIPESHGVGGNSEPKFNDHIWPGVNRIIYAAIEDSMAPRLLDEMKRIKEGNIKEGLKCFIQNIEGMI